RPAARSPPRSAAAWRQARRQAVPRCVRVCPGRMHGAKVMRKYSSWPVLIQVQAGHFATRRVISAQWPVIIRCGLNKYCKEAFLMLSQELTEIFSEQGPIAGKVAGYRPRQAQLEMAQAIGQALQDHATLIAEAGTGTGKTWAYLVPAFLSNAKVLVSTGTRTLQDQLFRRDLPRLREALALPIDIALLKGRGNYVCHYHLQRLQNDDRALKSRAEVAQLRHIQVFAQNTRSGD